ncbi:MAG TPA: hypothetical protein VGH89_13545 [Pseudonocardia sp.]|jgi:hypothetical protein
MPPRHTRKRQSRLRSPFVALLLAAGALCAACGGQPAPASPPVTPGHNAKPAWPAPAPWPSSTGPKWPTLAASPPGGPSISARQVCDPNNAQKAIAQALSLRPTSVTSPTWVDHLYTCRYNYPNGSFTLSVKELTGDSQTVDYIDQLAARFGQKQQLEGIGQGAFWTTNGSLVTRKDNKVLLVDITNLPAQFANPPQPPKAISRVIGTVIMGCWTDA